MISEITLFDFQSDAVNYLLDATTDPGTKHKIILKSPTGSGKTVILLSYIDTYLGNVNAERVFVWLTPGKGNLEEQSEEKMRALFPHAKTGNVHDVLLQGFSPGSTYFINWEMITKSGNTALKEGERKNLFERITDAHRSGIFFTVIIDEEHLNNTSKANDILSALSSEHEIRVSATTKKISTAEFYEIPEEEVIASGLITRALYINEGVDISEMDDLDSEALFLLQMADDKRKEIKAAYGEQGEKINPLVIVQFPDMSDRLIEYVESCLEDMGYTYNNGLVSKWMSDEKINTENVTEHNNPAAFLLMKQAISTGWDCPRAKVLVKLRENMTETFEIQTLGRLRRMPQAKHYGDDRLDFCFLYTFDEKYKEVAMQSGNAYEVRRLFLKENCRDFTLVKEVRNQDYEYVNEREARDKIYDYFIEKYKLTTDKAENKNRLEAYGYIFGTKIFSRYRSGKFQRLHDITDERQGQHLEISYEVSTHDHGIDCLHAVDMVKKDIGLPSNKTRAILQHLFHKMIRSNKKLIALSNREWYAFMINNTYKLREDFTEVATLPNLRQMQYLEKKREPFKLPLEDFYRYQPYEPDVQVYEKNAYQGYDTSMTTDALRSTCEQLFEYELEGRDDVEWFYKNGDTGQQYLSIVYGTNISKEYLFYPDYIIQKGNGDVWIIESKGGEVQGKSKNIDRNIENKFIAFKEYAEKENIHWGFVRDRNHKLFINNTEYSEDMSSPEWVRLEDKF